SRPIPMRPIGKLVAARTLVEEMRVPPRLTEGLNVVLKSARSGPFCQMALLVWSNSWLRPTVVVKFVVLNQRAAKFVMNALVGKRMAARPLLKDDGVMPKNV